MSRLRLLVVLCLFSPWNAYAQAPGTMPRIGLLEVGTLSRRAPLWDAFREGMRELGYVEGRTVAFEARGADGSPERLKELAAELVRLKVDVIVTAGPATWAAKQATATIPIVRASGNLLEGEVAGLARPGGNLTGVTSQSLELSAKRLELAHELVPGASRLAVLGSGSAAADLFLKESEKAARARGIRLQAVSARSPSELDDAFSTIMQGRPAALIVIPGPEMFGERQRLAELALRHRLPTVHAAREFVEAGGLIAYGTSLPALFRRASVYVVKILRGARPGDLPVEQPTTFELVVNLKAAKTLGVTIPQSILSRADEIIQ
jgi:putative ABC transport system substrate-binding protein